jgi:4-carboxymuconolactone decarboxylase
MSDTPYSSDQAVGGGQDRFPQPPVGDMSADQLEFVNRFNGFAINKGKGPFRVLLHSPEPAAAVIAMGDYFRTKTAISQPLIELLILAHSRVWDDRYEWHLHANRASQLGVADDVINELHHGRFPNVSDPEGLILGVTIELEIERRIRDATFERALHAFGNNGLADITLLVGQYALVSTILAASNQNQGLEPLPLCDQPFADYLASYD